MFRPLWRAAKAVGRFVLLRCLMLVALLAAMTGCAQATKPTPPPAQCDASCYVPCTTAGIAWTADPTRPEAYDALGEQVIQPLGERVLTCETRRRACHACQLRLQDAGLILGVPPLPPTD